MYRRAASVLHKGAPKEGRNLNPLTKLVNQPATLINWAATLPDRILKISNWIPKIYDRVLKAPNWKASLSDPITNLLN